jgi:transcriptional regulator with XRE-family HTH domain
MNKNIEPVYKAIGSRIAMMRELLDITQTDLASRMTITRPSLANIEAGRQRILVHQIQTIARALGTTPKSLMKGIWW